MRVINKTVKKITMKKIFILSILLILSFGYVHGTTSKERLNGKWKCIKERDGAKIIGGYMESIEFSPDELILFYVGAPGTPFRCSYSLTGKFIKATNLKTNERWNFGYKFLENGDLYLHKEPWNWQGWFTRNFERPRVADPQDPKNVYDYMRKQNDKK